MRQKISQKTKMAYNEDFDGMDSNNMQYEDDYSQEMTSPGPS